LAGLERTDSLAFDLHKWLHVPYDVAMLLVKDPEQNAHSFEMTGAYLFHLESGLATGPDNYMQKGLQISRGFRALKAWMTIKEHGVDKLGQLLAKNVHQARSLAQRIDAEAGLERIDPVALNIVCFRFRIYAASIDEDELNRRILLQLHQEGVAGPSHTIVNGHSWLRSQSRTTAVDAITSNYWWMRS
jgi:aromatic-L-amino-acid decarboxylase